ncbi:MAG: hypothetical protein WCY82_02425 [Desulfotomaculaceae bacterium]
MLFARPRKQAQTKCTSYHLSPEQLEELQKKYGQPGEMAPGQPAPKKRRRLDARLSEMDRKEKNLLELDDDNSDADSDSENPVIH